MRPEITVVLAVFLAIVGINSAQPMFSRVNRPDIFRRTWGEAFFFLVTTAIWIFGLSLIVWSFKNITWYFNLPVLVGALVLSAIGYAFVPTILRETALGPIVSAIGLTLLHNWAWFGSVAFTVYMLAVLLLVGSLVWGVARWRNGESGSNSDRDIPTVINSPRLKTIPNEWLSEKITVSVRNGELSSPDLTDSAQKYLHGLHSFWQPSDEVWIFHHDPHHTGWVYEGLAIRRNEVITTALVTNETHINYGESTRGSSTQKIHGKPPNVPVQTDFQNNEEATPSFGVEVIHSRTLLRRKRSEQALTGKELQEFLKKMREDSDKR